MKDRSLEILLKLLNKFDESPEFAGSDLSDFFLGQVANRDEVFPDLSHVIDESLLDVVFLFELGGFGEGFALAGLLESRLEFD